MLVKLFTGSTQGLHLILLAIRFCQSGSQSIQWALWQQELRVQRGILIVSGHSLLKVT